jgi:alpha-L-arabinofuranosidase
VLQLAHSELGTFPKIMPKSKPERVAYVDALVTADDRNLYFHALNRSLAQPAPVSVDFSAQGSVFRKATWHLLDGDPAARVKKAPITRETATELVLSGANLTIELPPHSVSVIVVPR